MGRAKQLTTSADIDAQIRRLQQERERAIVAEDQRRGALIRDYLNGGNGDVIRAALGRVVSSRDAYLFGLGEAAGEGESARRRPRAAGASGP